MNYAIIGALICWVLYKVSQNPPNIGSGEKLTADKARQVLGVTQDATKAEIQQAYQSLIKKLHPDTGGSDYLAQLTINAKKVLDDE